MKLGVCYYPEQWPKRFWENDARRMRELGIEYVRIGEFAWAKIEPAPGRFQWQWLDEALHVLDEAGLKVVLGTPTASPPKWLVDKYPEILPVDREGRIRKFGSRRHYCFSSHAYRTEAERIVTALAERYGKHPAVVGWQLDNEYGCHDTVRCYCHRCRDAFRNWLKEKYQNIDTLNKAWGTVFWSQHYRDFEEIELPNLTVARPNPSHLLDYYRFASRQVISFNALQARIIRELSPGRFITHNFEDFSLHCNHFALGGNLDFASWDNYPIGTYEVAPQDLKIPGFQRTGDPDIAAFHHDLYRRVGKGRFWIMEQQPGPLNWGRQRRKPAPGMVRLWTWEAFAHGAEVVSFFRWRQVPYGQEQMHSGLLLPDGSPNDGYHEAQKVAQELAHIALPPISPSEVALIFDYESAWIYEIEPHTEAWSYPRLVLTFYRALRRLGLNIDVLPPGDSLEDYKMVVVPTLPMLRDETLKSFVDSEGFLVFGPRTGSKTEGFSISPGLPPGPLRELIPIRVRAVEGSDEGETEVNWDGRIYRVGIWREWAEGDCEPIARFADGTGAVFHHDRYFYIAFWPPEAFLLEFFAYVARKAGLKPMALPEGLRIRRRGKFVFAFNYSQEVQRLPVPEGVRFILGGESLPPHDLAVWVEPDQLPGDGQG